MMGENDEVRDKRVVRSYIIFRQTNGKKNKWKGSGGVWNQSDIEIGSAAQSGSLYPVRVGFGNFLFLLSCYHHHFKAQHYLLSRYHNYYSLSHVIVSF